MNPALGDELTSINAIFNPDTLAPVSSSDPSQNADRFLEPPDFAAVSCALRLPSRVSISLRLTFPASYPEQRPYVSGILTAGSDGTKKGDVARLQELVKSALDKVWVQGEPCVYDLIEECESILTAERSQDDGRVSDVDPEQQAGGNDTANISPQSADESQGGDGLLSQLRLEDVSPQWALSEALTAKDSTFLARAATVTSPLEARAFIAHLVSTDKRVARATHNITAWRIRLNSGSEENNKAEVTYQDSDDDGESAAGGRVLKLMQMLDVWNVVVVVSRWFGGTLLGPERFRCIGIVARDVLVSGGFVETGRDRQEQGKGKTEGKGDKIKRKGKK